MVNSNVEPRHIEVDYIKNGIARLLVHWDITKSDVVDSISGTSREQWDYEEQVVTWTLPLLDINNKELEIYLDKNSIEILSYAQAAKTLNYSRPVPNIVVPTPEPTEYNLAHPLPTLEARIAALEAIILELTQA
jgi:hypothetical protein